MNKIEEYKGFPVFAMYEENNPKSVLSFGIKKAKWILDNIIDIQAFYDKYKKEK